MCINTTEVTNYKNNTVEPAILVSVFAMSAGVLSNCLALMILVSAYRRFRLKSKANFLFFAAGLVFTDFLGHVTNGSLALYVYAQHKNWSHFDPHEILCNIFGVCMVFFGLCPLILGSVMAVERCIGITNPLLHSTKLAPKHMKKLLFLVWLLAMFVALLPIIVGRHYKVQESRSWCFFKIQKLDGLDRCFLLLFSVLGLLSLFAAMLCNTITGFTLVKLKMKETRHRQGRSHHFEMICQLLAIMLVSFICWGPFLVCFFIIGSRGKNINCETLLLAVRIATWNQILDPWVYILLRKAVLKKIFFISRNCCGYQDIPLDKWNCNSAKGSLQTPSFSSRTDFRPGTSLRVITPDTAIVTPFS
ncbi:prostaglandin F2-alpha receptor [Erpetoichthys calabaricus]|uniref:Prostaglandin F2-alpha receptor n=1 Tax=Erpetoichthys calabaricus TaxID=27687 RepID=A0A8C4S2D7_ERPCA|nr:prostaglandin F2-alpha receptor [Erpetoichthys calabaricus]XP_028666999.1 prostaglandin F2-alpha receptor [Erpetoichthys calabaricus]